jgi:hypothetical protein
VPISLIVDKLSPSVPISSIVDKLPPSVPCWRELPP